jgi:hypothetical protein
VADLKQLYQELQLDDVDLLNPLGETLKLLGYEMSQADFKDLSKNRISFHQVPVKGTTGIALVRVSAQTAASENDFAQVKVILGPVFYYAGWRSISVFMGLPYLTPELKLWRKALESSFASAAIITQDDVKYFKEKPPERMEVVKSWFDIAEVPPDERLSEKALNHIVERFTATATNYPTGPKEFFNFLVKSLDLPTVLAAQVAGAWSTPNNVGALIAWARDQKVFPERPGYTMLGAVLKCFYEKINPDDEIKNIIRTNHLIPDQDGINLQMAVRD